MEKFLKKKLTGEEIDKLRINLSVRDVKLSSDPVCDFCGNSEPMWVYAAVRTSSGEWRSCWRWTACRTCSEAIDMEAWGVVETKVVGRLQRVFPELPRRSLLAVVKTALLEFHLYAETEKENESDTNR